MKLRSKIPLVHALRLLAVGALTSTMIVIGGRSPVANAADQIFTTTAITNASTVDDPTVIGQTYNVTFSVTPDSSGPATGTVLVTGDGTCSASVATGQCTLTSKSAGTKSITASYLGSGSFVGSSSSEVSHVVSAANTTTTITNATSLSTTSTLVNAPYDVQWSVAVTSPGVATPGGFVYVQSDGMLLCAAATSAGKCTVTPTSAATYTIVASFQGDKSLNPSDSSSVNHTVGKVGTSIAITNTADLAVNTLPKESYEVKWQVTVNSPSTLTATGTVTVTVDGGTGCTAQVGRNGAGSCNLRTATSGTHSIVATFNGGIKFQGSVATAVNHVVKTSTTTTITTDLSDDTVVNTPVDVAWIVTPSVSGGTVTVTMGDDSCSAAVTVGHCSVTPTTTGRKTVKATYGGDTTYAPSTSSSVRHKVTESSPD